MLAVGDRGRMNRKLRRSIHGIRKKDCASERKTVCLSIVAEKGPYQVSWILVSILLDP